MVDWLSDLEIALEDVFNRFYDDVFEMLSSFLPAISKKEKTWLSITNFLTSSENMYMETPKHLIRSRLSWLPKWLLSGPLLLWLFLLLLSFGSSNSCSLSVEVGNVRTTLYY